MNTSILAVNSVTYAVKAKKLLRQAGIYAKLKKVDRMRIKTGCQYAIEIARDDFLSAVAILRTHNIPYSIDEAE